MPDDSDVIVGALLVPPTDPSCPLGVIFFNNAGKAYDRSPCGTGTSAKLACPGADGKPAAGEPWGQGTNLGSTLTGRYRREGERIIPTITGTAFVTAASTLLLDEKDPFR